MSLNDEHQGEGGTLVFVAVYITINYFRLQGFKLKRFLILHVHAIVCAPGGNRTHI